MSSSVKGIATLPEELLIEVFSLLSPGDLASCCRVNHQWSRIAGEKSLWRSLDIDLSDLEGRVFNREGLFTRLLQAESLKVTSSRRHVQQEAEAPEAWVQALCTSGLNSTSMRRLEISGIPLSQHCIRIGGLIGSLSDCLQELCLRQTLVGSETLFMFGDMVQLRKLDLSYTSIEDAGLEAIRMSKYGPQLEELRLDAVMRVSHEGMTAFLETWQATSLKLISLSHNESVRPAALREFVSRTPGLAVSIRGSDHFTVQDVTDVREAGKCRTILHSAVLEDWSLESLRRYVDYLTSGVEWVSVKE